MNCQARITLARALYSPAEILLLDDILAALDVHTAKHVVSEALQGDLIRGRTVLLVTHNIALTAPIASHVIVLGRHGQVSTQGSVPDVLKRDTKLRAEVEKGQQETEEIESKVDKEEDGDVDTKPKAGKLIIAEEKAIGRVERDAFMLYFEGMGGPLTWMIFIGLILVGRFLSVFTSWFSGYWSSQYETHPTSGVPALL